MTMILWGYFAVLLIFCLAGWGLWWRIHRGVGSYQATGTSHELLISELEKQAFAYQGPSRNPVIIVHGFLGSTIFDNEKGDELWGSFDPAGITPDKCGLLAHPMAVGKNLDELRNQTGDRNMLDTAAIHLAGLNFQLPGYNRLIKVLEKIGYRRKDSENGLQSIYEFHYDWRRDLVENSKRLYRFILDTRRELGEAYLKRDPSHHRDIQFDLVGHSMGGLISRYCLMFGDDDLPADGSIPVPHWKLSQYVDKLFVVGTPNAGYLDTIAEMSNGLRLAPGATPYPAALIATFPSCYFMLPEGPGGHLFDEAEPDVPLDLFDLRVWQCYNLGLLNPANDNALRHILPEVKTRQQRYAIALDHIEKCLKRAKRFRTVLNQTVVKNPGKTELFLFAGDTTLTAIRATVGKDGKVKVTEYGAGDGKVLTASCRFDRCLEMPFFSSPIPWNKLFFINATHMGMLDDEAFIANFRFQLLMDPTDAQLAEVLNHGKNTG